MSWIARKLLFVPYKCIVIFIYSFILVSTKINGILKNWNNFVYPSDCNYPGASLLFIPKRIIHCGPESLPDKFILVLSVISYRLYYLQCRKAFWVFTMSQRYTNNFNSVACLITLLLRSCTINSWLRLNNLEPFYTDWYIINWIGS
jgi:hypothetical protein